LGGGLGHKKSLRLSSKVYIQIVGLLFRKSLVGVCGCERTTKHGKQRRPNVKITKNEWVDWKFFISTTST